VIEGQIMVQQVGFKIEFILGISFTETMFFSIKSLKP
jgi:hypothetical protein